MKPIPNLNEAELSKKLQPGERCVLGHADGTYGGVRYDGPGEVPPLGRMTQDCDEALRDAERV